MILAVAALALQLAPFPLAIPASANKAATAAAETSLPTSAPAASSEPALAREPEASTATHFNFDKVSLNVASSESSSPKLNAVSLESTSDSQTLSNVRIPEIQPTKPEEIKLPERQHDTRSWLALSLVQHAAATFDAYSTRQAVGRGAVEDDPMMRPFAHSGGIYAAIQAGPVALDFLARRMQHSEIGAVRRMWWLPQTVSTATFLFAGVHNLGVSPRH